MHPKAKRQNVPTFTGNGSHSHVCLLLVRKIKSWTFQLYKRQSADTNVLIARYWLSADCRCVFIDNHLDWWPVVWSSWEIVVWVTVYINDCMQWLLQHCARVHMLIFLKIVLLWWG